MELTDSQLKEVMLRMAMPSPDEFAYLIQSLNRYTKRRKDDEMAKKHIEPIVEQYSEFLTLEPEP